MDNKHEVGIIGLGRIGFRVSENLRDKGYRVAGFDIVEENNIKFTQSSMHAVSSLEELCQNLQSRRIVLFLLPAGKVVDDSIKRLIPLLEKGDIIADCGNSYYKDSISRYADLEKRGICFMDVGISGGVEGARNGACLTIGGEYKLFKSIEYLFKDMSVKNGYLHVGPVGWGHLVKTVHNSIEYGFLQAIGEGLNVINTISAKENVTVDMTKICKVWGNGSIVESRLMADTVKALRILKENPSASGIIGGGETGNWAQKIAGEYGVAVPALNAAIESRKESQHNQDFASKIIAAIRNVFGEHELLSIASSQHKNGYQ